MATLARLILRMAHFVCNIFPDYEASFRIHRRRCSRLTRVATSQANGGIKDHPACDGEASQSDNDHARIPLIPEDRFAGQQRAEPFANNDTFWITVRENRDDLNVFTIDSLLISHAANRYGRLATIRRTPVLMGSFMKIIGAVMVLSA